MPNAVHETTAATVSASSEKHHPNPLPDIIAEECDLASANPAAIMTQLSALIGEINQPISAVVMNAEAALWLLLAQTADMEAVRQLLTCIVRDGMRAGDIVNCTRALTDRKRADERMRAREISLCVTET
jgi:hypothetical protein